MVEDANPIEQVIDANGAEKANENRGEIERMLSGYTIKSRTNLLGFLLKMGFEDMTLVTCDAWKRSCGGVPKNSFVIVRLNEQAMKYQPQGGRPFLILARIRDTAMTPVASEIQSTIFQIHKVQADIDPLTSVELQWGALTADILGTYYDDGDGAIAFGNDIDSFVSPHFYEIYVPTDEHLELLINSFVAGKQPIRIGRVRYTETETLSTKGLIPVSVSPTDFLCNRTALFGKTRMGKSNTIKVLLDTMLAGFGNLGQVVFDLSGEYTYPDPQTGASIYANYKDKCVRYSLSPRTVKVEEAAGLQKPSMMKADFYRQVKLGHSIICGMFDSKHDRRPDYMSAFLAWDPVDAADAASTFPDHGERNRFFRALAMYKSILYEAGFPGGAQIEVRLNLSKKIRQKVAENDELADRAKLEQVADGEPRQIDDEQRLPMASQIFAYVWNLLNNLDETERRSIFPTSKSSGKRYFEPLHRSLLQMLGSSTISGPKKLTPFTQYHSADGSDVAKEVVEHVEAGKTVLIDLSQADQEVAVFYTELLSRRILSRQMSKFASLPAEEFERHSVLFYFEEAHNLFRSDDKDLKSIYNKLAKEGGKFRIGMVYATQSMSTLSPDLRKNTENFFIAHLSDTREIRELEAMYEFSTLGLDIQRARSKGYVRMITLSHRYALPVQVKLFTLSVADDPEEPA